MRLDPLIERVNTHFVPAIGGIITRSGCDVESLTVEVWQNGELKGSDTVDAMGAYFIPDLAAGDYKWRVKNAKAYLGRPRTITVVDGQPTSQIDGSVDGNAVDSDQDGVSDCWEIQWFGGLVQTGSDDYDQDGLTNLEELRYGMNPKNIDSDGDGFNDGTEVAQGTDPHNQNSFVPLGAPVVFIDWDTRFDDVDFFLVKDAVTGNISLGLDKSGKDVDRDGVDGEPVLIGVSPEFKSGVLKHIQKIFDASGTNILITDKRPTKDSFLRVRFAKPIEQYIDGIKEKSTILGQAYDVAPKFSLKEFNNPTGVDQFNRRPDGEIAVFFDSADRSFNAEVIAEIIAHETGHGLGLRHVNPDGFCEPYTFNSCSPLVANEVMDYDFAPDDIERFTNQVSNIIEPPTSTSLGDIELFTHNPVYHLLRFSLGKSNSDLVNRNIFPGTWDLYRYSVLRLRLTFVGGPPKLFNLTIQTKSGTNALAIEDEWSTLAYFKDIDASYISDLEIFVREDFPLRILASSTRTPIMDIFFGFGDESDPVLVINSLTSLASLTGSIFQFSAQNHTFSSIGTFDLRATPIATISANDAISVTPSALDFGQTNVNTEKDLDLTIKNTGEETLEVSCADEPPFTFPLGCNFSVAAGGSSQIKVGFSPTVAGASFASLIIASNHGDVVVPAKAEGITTNEIPTANAGPDRTVRLGSLVTLNGSASADPDNGPAPLSFAWSKTVGPAITLTGANTANPKFTPNTAGSYTFSLTVNDGASDSPSASVNITVPALGDIDRDGDVDNNDLSRITSTLNKPASGPNDLRDINGDMKIDALDSRRLVLLCTRPRCATQ